MTTGQLLFYGGIVLAVLTVLVAALFVIFKPKYRSESAAYYGKESNATQKLRNGYPTDKITRRRSENVSRRVSAEPTETIGTELMEDGGGNLILEEDKSENTAKF